ncbi:MAG TPA: MATE family efflux transporter [Caulobacteraceae bacterium]|nr:MATE family efflux transporter [Caulobacteraceae bacterium]
MEGSEPIEGARPAQGHRLTEGPITKTLFWFSLPVLGSSALQSLNGSVNAVWVGQFLGEAGLTATANANLVLFLLLGAVFGVGMAATIMVGQAVGARDMDQAKRVAGTGAAFFAASSLLVALAGYLFTPTILRLLDTPPEALPLAEDYLRIIFIALPPIYFLAFLTMTLRGAGDARTPLMFMTVTVVVDVGLNPLLIQGIGPFPRMGIAGSAMATLVGQVVSLTAMLIYIYRKPLPLRLVGEELKYLRPDPAILLATIVKGLPMGMQMIVVSGSAIVMMSMVNAYGTVTAAAYGVAAQIWTYIQMPAMAIGASASAMAAQNVGAGQWRRVELTARSGALINLALTGGLVVLVYLAEPFLLRLFLPGDAAAIAVASHINLIVAWSFIMFGVTFVLFGVVRSTGAVTAPLISLAISLLGIRVAFARGLEGAWGADAIWWSFPVSMAASVLLAFGYYRWGGWRKARMGPLRTSGEADPAGFAAPAMDALAEEKGA